MYGVLDGMVYPEGTCIADIFALLRIALIWGLFRAHCSRNSWRIGRVRLRPAQAYDLCVKNLLFRSALGLAAWRWLFIIEVRPQFY